MNPFFLTFKDVEIYGVIKLFIISRQQTYTDHDQTMQMHMATSLLTEMLALGKASIEGSNMIFHSLTFARSRGKC